MLSVNLRFGTVRIWYTGMKPSVMQEGAVYPGPLSRVPVCLLCYILQCFYCTTGYFKRKPHAWLYKPLLHFPTAAGVLETFEFFVSIITYL